MAADAFGQFAGFSSNSEERDEDRDNGMADPANLDLADQPDDELDEALSFEDKVDRVAACVTRHPLHREILFKVLEYCKEERVLRSIEQEITTYPEWPRATQNQYSLVTSLVKAGGLDYIERDIDGNLVTDQDKEGLTEDEAEDLVETFNYKTTDAGVAFLEAYDPAERLAVEFGRTPERIPVYREVLDYVSQGTRTIDDINALLEGREMGTYVNGRYETIKPSVFVDKLEHAGALVWDKGWVITKEGEAYLKHVKDAG
ncbi:MAG: hypothetical protein IJ131_08335 [Eggerthellaceae bacterium]|nr:hypothetical protein [Eggerthellaceae bacterium]